MKTITDPDGIGAMTRTKQDMVKRGGGMKKLLVGLLLLGFAGSAGAQIATYNQQYFLDISKKLGDSGSGGTIIGTAIPNGKACSLTVQMIGMTGGLCAVGCSVKVNTGGTLTMGYRVGQWPRWSGMVLKSAGDSMAVFNAVGAGYRFASVNLPYTNRIGFIFSNPGSDTVWLRELTISVGSQ
jgi:hypothetical protein